MARKDFVFDPVVNSLPSLQGKCYAITGTTSGTGFWAAVAAVRKGAACVFLLNRKSARAESAEQRIRAEGNGPQVVTVDCDLQSFASVRSAAAHVRDQASTFGGLDGLLNNAGCIGGDLRTPDGYEMQMQVNHLSHFLLTKLLMTSLEAAASARGEARVVQHSSGMRGIHGGTKTKLDARYFRMSEGGTLGGNKMNAVFERYHQTKLANSVFAILLHDKLAAANSGVKSLCAEPGSSATEFGMPRTPQPGPKHRPPGQSAADGACSLILAAFAESAGSGDFYMPGDLEGHLPVGMPVKCMTNGRPTPINDSMAKRFNNEDLTLNAGNREVLWLESEMATEVFCIGNVSKL